MTDNRTTELREKLDELSIKHFDYDKGGRTQTQWEAPDGKRHFTYETSGNPAKTARLVIAWHPTPEQAIAATLGDEQEIDIDKAYVERIKPRFIEGTPTENIRRWSVLAHSVMEVTGLVPFGMDGSVQLWLHERSLTQLLDMCDEVDERFETLGNGTLTAEQVSKATYAHSIHADCADADWQAIADELNANLGNRTCHLEETVHQREIATEFGGGYYDETTYDCDECGFENIDYNIRFCGGCGARVVSHEE